MAEIIRMPRLSDTMEEGVIVEWNKKVGDKVGPGDILAEVETDKATMELESFQEGTLLHIEVKEGAVPVDGVIAVIGEEGEKYEEQLEKARGGTEEKAEDEDEAEAKDEEKAEGEDKGEEKEKSGEKKDKAGEKADKGEAKEETKEDKAKEGDRIKASPLARKMAEEEGIDLGRMEGSGDGGRIVKRDIEKAIEEGVPGDAEIPAMAAKGPAYEDREVSQMRKTIAKRLAESKFNAPHFYLTVAIDMTNAIQARKQINESIEPDKISFNDLIVKAAAMALRKHPQVNASWMGDKLRYHNEIHVGVAVAVSEGLLVPVIRHTDYKTLQQINKEVREKADLARKKKLDLDEMKGNTFTISNLGMMGIEEFTAIINPPEACILAVGAIIEKPVVKNGELAIGQQMKVTMSCDHRVVDGATGAEFLQTFKSFMEAPVRMLS